MSGGIKISCPKLVDLTGLIANDFFFECLDSLNKAELEPKFMGNIKYVLFPGISHVEHLLIDLNFFSQVHAYLYTILHAQFFILHSC